MSADNWVAEAIAEQEEHIKRVTSCKGVVGMAHSFDTFSMGPSKAKVRKCWRCGVTETPEDYAKNIAKED